MFGNRDQIGFASKYADFRRPGDQPITVHRPPVENPQTLLPQPHTPHMDPGTTILPLEELSFPILFKRPVPQKSIVRLTFKLSA